MSVSLEGLQSGIAGEERAVALLKVEHNGQTYDWSIYIPPDVDLSDYLNSKELEIYADIDNKEAQWEALTPKTRDIIDSFTGETQTFDIDKSEIVKPDFPDYYAKRRTEYPSLSDQLDAMWKGGNALSDMLQKINEVKEKYPKP
jgi:hypothetical protein